MKTIRHLQSNPETAARVNRIVDAMNELFQVQEPGLTMNRNYRGIVAKHAAVRAIMAAEDCGRQTAEILVGAWTNPNKRPRSLDEAHAFAGMVTTQAIWDVVEEATGASKDDVNSGSRRDNVVAARFLVRLLLANLVAMSGPEVSVEAGHKSGYNGEVPDSVRDKAVKILAYSEAANIGATA